MIKEGDIVQLSRLSEVQDIFHLSALGLHPDRQYKVITEAADGLLMVEDCLTGVRSLLPEEQFIACPVVTTKPDKGENEKVYLGAYVSKKLKRDIIALSQALNLSTNRMITHSLLILVEQAKTGGILPKDPL